MALINRKVIKDVKAGKVTLYQLSGQKIGGKYYKPDNWYASIKLPKNIHTGESHPLRRFSTGESDFDNAFDVALEEFWQLSQRQKHNLPLSSVKYSSVCRKFIEKLTLERRFLEEQNTNHYTKLSVSKKIQTVNRFLIPFFGEYDIEDIRDNEIKRFKSERVTDVGGRNSKKKCITAGTLNKTLTVFRQIFKYAVEEGYIESSRIPLTGNKATSKDEIPRNPSFSSSEYRRLISTANWSWKKEKHPRIRNQKYLLFHLILILSNTGGRMAEIKNLRWNDIVSYKTRVRMIPKGGDVSDAYLEDVTFIKIAFFGKVSRSTQKRFSSPKQKVKVYFDRLKEMQQQWSESNGWEWKENGKVFVNSQGEEVANFNKGFNALLKKTNLTYAEVGVDENGEAILKKRNLGGLRHLYAIKMLRTGWDYFTLAKNMRTSPEMLTRFYANEVDVEKIPLDVIRMRQQRNPAIEENLIH